MAADHSLPCLCFPDVASHLMWVGTALETDKAAYLWSINTAYMNNFCVDICVITDTGFPS